VNTSGSKPEGLRHGPLSGQTVHICVDMQRLFAEDTEWKTPWMKRVLPNVVRLVDDHPEHTIFTRFVPAAHPGDGEGIWRRYWRRWASMTLECLPEGMADLVPDLARFAPPAPIIDKSVYSPWQGPRLQAELTRRKADTLIVTGGETDVCVLATVLGAVDRGYRVVLVADALCSSSDDTHDASMAVYANRYGQQVETISTADLLGQWPLRAQTN
jgi:nicotinamidase-related amidase